MFNEVIREHTFCGNRETASPVSRSSQNYGHSRPDVNPRGQSKSPLQATAMITDKFTAAETKASRNVEENPQPPPIRTAEQIKIEILEEELKYARHRAQWMGQRAENAKIDAQYKMKRLEMLGKENMEFVPKINQSLYTDMDIYHTINERISVQKALY